MYAFRFTQRRLSCLVNGYPSTTYGLEETSPGVEPESLRLRSPLMMLFGRLWYPRRERLTNGILPVVGIASHSIKRLAIPYCKPTQMRLW
jgi:hypothetical protein